MGEAHGPQERVPNGAGSAGWQKARNAVMTGVTLSQAFATLRDMSSDTYIEPSALKSIKHLGEGAYATVDKAWYTPKDGSDQIVVAVKRIKKEIMQHPDDLALFVKEVQLMKKLRHRNIVEFIGAGEVNDGAICAYVVQEYMEGGTLKQLVVRQMLGNGQRTYSSSQALAICLQVARGLRYLHRVKPMVIHRDLKLENVLLKRANPVDGKYEVKLADFGLSAQVQVKQQRLAGHKASVTQQQLPAAARSGSRELEAMWTQRANNIKHKTLSATGQAPDVADLLAANGHQSYNLTGRTGSLMYMAPEVFREEPYSEKADVFSFAILMYEVLHCYVMLSAVSVAGTYEELEEYCAGVAAGYRPPLHDDWPESISSIIKACWSDDPFDRPGMDEVVRRLEAAQAAGELDGHDSMGCGGCRCTIS